MLLYPPSHNIEGMIRFMLYTGGLIEGHSKEEFVIKISHKITRYQTTTIEFDFTDENIAVHAPWSTLREKYQDS